MKCNAMFKAALALMAFAMFALLPPAALAGTGEKCTLESVKGSWDFTYSGSVLNPANGSFVPAAEIGVISFDGAGSASGTDIFSAGGSATNQTFTGTYTENPDCSGMFTLVVTPGSQTVTGSWVAGEDHGYLIFTSPGFTMSGSSSRVTH